MQTYGVRDVERVLRLSRSTLRGLIEAGFIKPQRDARRQYRFSFRDLIVLRATRALIDAKVSPRRIKRALADLRRRLPESLPLSGLSISAEGDRIVVREGQARWQVDDGQYLLGFDVSVEGGELRVVERPQRRDVKPARPPEPVEDWFARALELEGTNPRAARQAYERAVRADPANSAAWINLGRLLHEQGEPKEAEKVYRRALRECGAEPLLMFNLGVLLEDMGRTAAALEAYEAAIAKDPAMADCHFNLARLYEAQGKRQHAIRHLGQYRRLTSRRTGR